MSQFPDFTDFLKALDKDVVADILRDAKSQSKMIANFDLEAPEHRLDMQISATSFAVCLEFLAFYHKWLE